MPVYVLEIAGRGVAALKATGREEAERIVNSDGFRADLMALHSEDRPVWNGLSQLILRDPQPVELAHFEAVHTERAKVDGDEENLGIATFLISLADPTDDLDDRDEMGGEG